MSEWPVDNLFKIFLTVWLHFLSGERGILSQNGKMENVLTIQGQIGEI